MAQTTPTPEYVLGLAAKLVDAKNRVAELEKEWAELFGMPAAVDSTPDDADDADGITARFLKFLEDRKPQAYTVPEVALAIDAEPLQLHRVIARMLPKGKIKRAGRGAYTAPDSEIADAA